MKGIVLLWLAGASACLAQRPAPVEYLETLREGRGRIEAALAGPGAATLRALEQRPGLRHFPHAILVPAVLYTQKRPENPEFGKAEVLALALRIGDLLAEEDERGAYMDRLDSYWDTTMWLDAYRLLEPRLGAERAARWRRALERNVELVAPRVAAWREFPRYTSPYLGTSTNHYAQWAANVFLAGRLFGREDWTETGSAVLHRFAAEQNADGYWGELRPDAPTSGYNLLTLSAVALYAEHSGDAGAVEAVRRATQFHLGFTWPSGEPVELFNDRNRHWEAGLYGNFGFSRTAEGRRLAAYLLERYQGKPLDTEQLGRVAQNLLYFRDGETAAIPQESAGAFRLQGPAGVRHGAPWSIALSGLSGQAPVTTQWFLDRQASVAVFHREKGLIVSGGNSRNQPELATFQERIGGSVTSTPLDARLEMREAGDRLWVAMNRYFAELFVAPQTREEARLRFTITGRGPAPDEARITLQLVLAPGQEIKTGTGLSAVVSEAPIDWGAAELGGVLMHNGWTLRLPEGARLRWPVRPYNPYRQAPERDLARAVGALSVELKLKPDAKQYVRPAEEQIEFTLRVGAGQ